jgi:hypothetical protein
MQEPAGWLLGAGVFACLVVVACGAHAPAQVPPRAIPSVSSTEVSSAVYGVPSPKDVKASPPPGAPQRQQGSLTVTEADGLGADELDAWIAPAQGRLEPCLSPNGGKVRVRVRDVEGKLAFAIEPGASLDATQRRCVLEALTALQDDGVRSAPWTGATIRPTGFTSLLTIEW